jgi:localization factor PodJL
MTSGVPWQVEGVGPEARESAREAARRSGMSVGEWLDSVISDQAGHQATHAPPGHGEITDVKERLDQVGRRLEELSRLNTGAAYLRPSLRTDEPPHGLGDDVISRLDQRLDQLMTPERRAGEAVEPHTGAARPTADKSKAIEQALLEIAQRQRALHADDTEPAAVVAPRAESPPLAPLPDLSNLEQQLRQVTTQIETLRPCGIKEAVETLRDDLAEIGLMLKEAMPRKSIEALEVEVRGLSERLTRKSNTEATDAAIAGIERGLAEVRDALRALTPAENLVGVEETVRELAQKIDRIAANATDPASMQQLEGAIVGLRGIANHVASDGALAKLSDEVSALATKVDQIASSATSGVDLLSTLERRLSSMAVALEARPPAEPAMPSDIDGLVRSLTDRLSELGHTRTDESVLGQLEERITSLVERLDTSNARFNHLETIERGLAELTADLERQRQSELERVAAPPPEVSSQLRQDVEQTKSSLESVQGALEQLVERLAAIESDVRQPPAAMPQLAAARPADSAAMPAAAPLRPAAPAIAAPPPSPEHRPIDPNLPPDHPLEPGATRGRACTSPSDRIAASEAALATVRPPAAPEAGSKSNFIAAARRAAQAANSEGTHSSEKRAPTPAADKGKPSKASVGWGSRVRAVLVAVSVVLIVLSSMHVVMSLFGSADAPEDLRTPELQTAPNAGTPVPPAPAPARQTLNAPSPPATVLVEPRQQAPIALPPGAAEKDVTGSISQAITAMSPTALPAIDASSASATRAPRVDKLPPTISGVLRAAAAKGDAAAEYEIAQRFAEGRGVPENLAEAADWYDRAAKQGLPIAQFRLGGFYEKGLGVKKDLDAARRLYIAAAEAGNAKAMHNLAVLYAEGIDGKPDYQTAAKWFRKAADYGLTDSQYNLGILYGRGIGMPLNLPEAYKWFTLAARDGDKESVAKRDDVGSRMDAQSLAAAKAAAEAFTPMEQPEAATQAPAPPGGWDIAAVAPASPKPRASASRADRPAPPAPR